MVSFKESLYFNLLEIDSTLRHVFESLGHDDSKLHSYVGEIKTLENLVKQSFFDLKSISVKDKFLANISARKALNQFSDNMSKLKLDIIKVINCLQTTKDVSTVKKTLVNVKEFMKTLYQGLDNIEAPKNVSSKLLHYQSSDVKGELKNVFNRELFKRVFNETHSHHTSKVNRVYPKFNRHGDFYHDGIVTHYDGLKFEDLYLQPNGKKVSCGFLVKDTNTGKYLGCHPTGQPSGVYDLPKGCMEVNDSPLQTAIRELYEETGLVVSENDDIKDFGVFSHKSNKDLHIYGIELSVDIDELHCDSKFKDFRDGNIKPEMDSFGLVDDAGDFLYSIQPVVEKCMF